MGGQNAGGFKQTQTCGDALHPLARAHGQDRRRNRVYLCVRIIFQNQFPHELVGRTRVCVVSFIRSSGLCTHTTHIKSALWRHFETPFSLAVLCISAHAYHHHHHTTKPPLWQSPLRDDDRGRDLAGTGPLFPLPFAPQLDGFMHIDATREGTKNMIICVRA